MPHQIPIAASVLLLLFSLCGQAGASGRNCAASIAILAAHSERLAAERGITIDALVALEVEWSRIPALVRPLVKAGLRQMPAPLNLPRALFEVESRRPARVLGLVPMTLVTRVYRILEHQSAEQAGVNYALVQVRSQQAAWSEAHYFLVETAPLQQVTYRLGQNSVVQFTRVDAAPRVPEVLQAVTLDARMASIGPTGIEFSVRAGFGSVNREILAHWPGSHRQGEPFEPSFHRASLSDTQIRERFASIAVAVRSFESTAGRGRARSPQREHGDIIIYDEPESLKQPSVVALQRFYNRSGDLMGAHVWILDLESLDWPLYHVVLDE